MKRYLQLIIGYFMMTLGISLLITAGLGVQAVDSVIVGLQKHLGFTIGAWMWIVNVVIMMIVALVALKKPYIKGIIGIIIVSLFVDGWLLLVFDNITISNVYLSIAMFVVGVIPLVLGAAIYLHTKLFTLPWDGLMLAVSERLNWSIKYAKMLIEVIALTIGFILGGGIGVGTVILVFGVGYLVQYALYLTRRFEWKE